MKLLRTALALLLSASIGLPAQARMSFDANGSDRLVMPSLRRAPVLGAFSGVVQLQKWKDALAAAQAGTKSARMLVFGGDDTVGNTTTTVNAQAGSWPQLLANAYAQQGYSVSTNSFFGNKNTLATNPYGASGSTYDTRLTMASVTLAGPSNAGLGNFPFNLTSASSAIAWTPSGQTDTTEVLYTKDGVTAAGFANVDGGTNTAITRSGNGVGLGKLTLTYARGSGHVINMGWTSGTFQIVGAISYDSTVKDVQIVNLGMMGGTVAEIGRNDTAYAPFNNLNNLSQLGGDLMVLQQSPWDQTSSVPLATVRATYGNIAAAGRDAGMDLLFLTGNAWDTSLTNMAAATQQTYVDNWKGLAANLVAPVIDIYGTNGGYAAQNAAGRQATVRFRNTAGHAADAAYIKAQLDNILTLPALSPPAPQTYDVADLTALNALNPTPGSTVRLARAATYAGPITLPWVGTADAPITLTTYGSTASPAVITGTPSPSYVTPNYIDAVTVTGSNIRVDGGTPIDGGKLGLHVKGSGRASFFKSSGTLGFDVMRTEMSNVGAGAIHYGRKGRYVGNYVHDLIIVKNTNGGGSGVTVSGEPNAAAWDDDDYGANGFIVSGSDVEIAWNRISRDITGSFDYRTDGGAFEFFPPYGFITNIFPHDNWIEGGDGVLEGGGPTGSGTGISNLKVSGNVALNNYGFMSFHNQGGSFESAWDRIDISFNTIVEENNTMSTRQTFILDGQATAKLAGFLSPTYGVNNNIVQINSGDAVFKQNNGTYHSGNVFNLVNNPSQSGAGGITHLYNDYGMTLATGESYANPQFVNQAGRDFSLQAGSPAIGKGHTAWTPVPVLGISAYPADYAAGSAKTFTQTTLTTSATTAASGASVTLTATMAPTAATGTVTFYDGATLLGTGTLSNGVATLATTALATGTRRVICTYGGDGTYAASISNAVTVTVN